MDHFQAKTRGKIAYLTAALLGSNQIESIGRSSLYDESPAVLVVQRSLEVRVLLR